MHQQPPLDDLDEEAQAMVSAIRISNPKHTKHQNPCLETDGWLKCIREAENRQLSGLFILSPAQHSIYSNHDQTIQTMGIPIHTKASLPSNFPMW